MIDAPGPADDGFCAVVSQDAASSQLNPDAQARGVGGALRDALLAGLPHERLLLSDQRAAVAAWTLYRRHGWAVLAEIDERWSLLGLRLRPGRASGS